MCIARWRHWAAPRRCITPGPRTKDKAEIDFCIATDGRPELFLEAKRSFDQPSKTLCRFAAHHNLDAVQLVFHLKREKLIDGIQRRRGADYLAALSL